jgi:hypothetical protein
LEKFLHATQGKSGNEARSAAFDGPIEGSQQSGFFPATIRHAFRLTPGSFDEQRVEGFDIPRGSLQGMLVRKQNVARKKHPFLAILEDDTGGSYNMAGG